MYIDIFKKIGNEDDIEKVFESLTSNEFSRECTEDYSKSPIDRYMKLKEALIPTHDEVETGALLRSAEEFSAKIQQIINSKSSEEEKKVEINKLCDDQPFIVLNKHGVDHIKSLLRKVSNLVSFINGGLNTYEIFILLCAIQIHDIGNFFGRKNHENESINLFEKKFSELFPDTAERHTIKQISSAHSGEINGTKDKIINLSIKSKLFDQSLRIQLLAAILRFADELADDNRRVICDTFTQENLLTRNNEIYIEYSKSLSPTSLFRDEFGRIIVNLTYTFYSKTAIKQFLKFTEKKYLLDEIYDRTLKMERERRYCNRFLRPFVFIDGIQVEIVISNSNYYQQYHKIQYQLEENGYPLEPKDGSIKLFTSVAQDGKEESQRIQKEWEGHNE